MVVSASLNCRCILSSSFVGISSSFIEIIAKSQTLVGLAYFSTDVDPYTTFVSSCSLLACTVVDRVPSSHLLLQAVKLWKLSLTTNTLPHFVLSEK